jgi:hypothetical protein
VSLCETHSALVPETYALRAIVLPETVECQLSACYSHETQGQMAAVSQSEITPVLTAWCAGDRAALEPLTPLMLYRAAHHHLLSEQPGRTLQTTALVNEAVELRFFGGLNTEETAEVLKASTATVARDWRLAKAWLLQELSPERSDGA